MQTLLTKVEDIEKQAKDLIESTRKQRLEDLQALQNREEKIISDTREKALARGKEIIAEKLQQANHEANSIKQNSEKTVEVVRKAAETNRADALTLANTFFTEDYLT